MEGPSTSSRSSNVSKRKNRIRIDDDDDEEGPPSYHPFAAPKGPLRKVRGNCEKEKTADEKNAEKMVAFCNNLLANSKVGAVLAFDFHSPLEEFGIEAILANKGKVHDMAALIESTTLIIGYRVDRLYSDTLSVDATINGGELSRANGTEDVHLNLDNRKARKKLAITDGMNGMNEYLNAIDELEKENDPSTQENEDENLAGEPALDVTANSKDVDRFLAAERKADFDALVTDIAIKRQVKMRVTVQNDSSSHVTFAEFANDLKDTPVDWLKTNTMFQKATKGSLDNTATSFHSLNHHGIHSESGRALYLHPRIHDDHENDVFFPSDAKMSLVNNTRCLIENSLAKKPQVIDNYLMLEVKDRPVVVKYEVKNSKNEAKRAGLPLSKSERDTDLNNMTFAETNRLDQTIVPSGLPLAVADNDETVVVGTEQDYDRLRKHQIVNANEEYALPELSALKLDDALMGKVPMDPFEMDNLRMIFDNKIREFNTSEDVETKAWKNGMRADEWGPDDQAQMKADTRGMVLSGIDGWIKATNSWTNYAVVKMPINREAKALLDEEEPETNRNLVPEIGKNIFLVQSNTYMNNYPQDRGADFKIVDEDADIMTLVQVDGEDVTADQVREQIQRRLEMENEPEIDDTNYEAAPVDDVEFDDRLVAPADDDDFVAQRPAGVNHEAEILFGDQVEEREEEINENQRLRQIEEIATGPDEIPELATAPPPEQKVSASAEQIDEIRNIGKTDNAHWCPPGVAEERLEAAMAARKKKSNKNKSKKVTVDEYLNYFRDLEDDEMQRELTANKCQQIQDEKNTFLDKKQIYMESLGTENKPHVAVDLTLLFSSGLYFKKSYGKLKLARVKPGADKELEAFHDDSKTGNKESDCLNWLLSFGGFRCVENPEAVDRTHEEEGNDDHHHEDYVDNYDDEGERYNRRYELSDVNDQMGPELGPKFVKLQQDTQKLDLHRIGDTDGDFDDEDFDYSFGRTSLTAKNLDAAKHKKCIAEILNNDTLSMPSIQYALEQLHLKKDETLRLNNTTIGPNTTQRDRSVTPAADADTTLTTVFDYHSPGKIDHDFNEILAALADMPDYVEEDHRAPNPDQPSTSEYGTANTDLRKVKIKGFHTLLSLALAMPPKMGESVKPSSIVSFILHVANENNLRIVQDRSKRSWMSDFFVLNEADQLPRGLKIGTIDETDEFWKRTQDPDAVQGSEADQSSVFANLISSVQRQKLVARRKGRDLRGDLRAISEEEEMEE